MTLLFHELASYHSFILNLVFLSTCYNVTSTRYVSLILFAPLSSGQTILVFLIILIGRGVTYLALMIAVVFVRTHVTAFTSRYVRFYLCSPILFSKSNMQLLTFRYYDSVSYLALMKGLVYVRAWFISLPAGYVSLKSVCSHGLSLYIIIH